mmetsp:Transcript_66370/g.185539  ORF Transcript_66370/g.185539 Transcript_66370/m.185539 type:complete len:170 (-) Transcript_66370:299-808(-)|eukprot:CAMPEP_0176241712 /NCGR_PEP_ID=MMETSP0121_2-20121125/30035_1 /TAXON_ID=160619 /ORGANISM="Kryptoperidinium foliaceum, Strain CCMP 1326" /LENGTH=169 /DNA_ID=CAMNT_0017581253 /DNA_START=67 /DNA_END=576 /DNA_ORIENTATION=-
MKFSSTVLILLPAAVNGFQVGLPSPRSAMPLFSMEGSTSTYDYTNGGFDIPAQTPDIAAQTPDIAPMDLVHQEPEPAAPQVSTNVIGKVPGHEQARFSGPALLGMDKWYKPGGTAMTAPPLAPPTGAAMIKVKKIKCYQTSNDIYRQAASYGPVTTPQELLDPKSFLQG